jgi:hypothetical protein
MLTFVLFNNSTRIYFCYIKIYLKQCTCGKIWSGIYFNPTFTFSLPRNFFFFSTRFQPYNSISDQQLKEYCQRSSYYIFIFFFFFLLFFFSWPSSLLYFTHFSCISFLFLDYRNIYCEIYHLFRWSCVCFVKIF